MATVTNTGIEVKSISDYKTQIDNIFLSSFDGNFNTDASTKQGQIIARLSLAMAQTDIVINEMFNATDIRTASGMQLDYIASNINIQRKPAVNTEVSCILTGVASTLVPAGSIAEDTNGNRYNLREDVVIGSSGSSTGIMVAISDGSISVLANTLTKIISVVSGWEYINNEYDGIKGVMVESDSEFNIRYFSTVSKNSLSQVSSIKSSLLQVEDIQDAIVLQNNKKEVVSIKSISLLPNSIACVVLGGSDQDIIDSIGVKLPVGIITNGEISGYYRNVDYYTDLAINFFRATNLDIEMTINISVDSSFVSDGIKLMKDSIISYLNENQTIGKDIKYSRMYTPINAVNGHEVNDFKIGIKDGTLSASDIVVDLNKIARIEYNNIDIVVS
jgi:uncharacterized phage protein gp47/JayE